MPDRRFVLFPALLLLPLTHAHAQSGPATPAPLPAWDQLSAEQRRWWASQPA